MVNVREVDRIIEDYTQRFTAAEVIATLEAAGVPAAQVLKLGPGRSVIHALRRSRRNGETFASKLKWTMSTGWNAACVPPLRWASISHRLRRRAQPGGYGGLLGTLRSASPSSGRDGII